MSFDLPLGPQYTSACILVNTRAVLITQDQIKSLYHKEQAQSKLQTKYLDLGLFGLENWTLSLAVPISDIKKLIKH